MSYLNSNMMIHTPFGSPKRFIKDSYYNTTDDDQDMVGSPISTSGSYDDSRRSSFSSFSSAASSPRLGSSRQRHSITSIKAAYERIEYLENYIQEQKEIEQEEKSKNDVRGLLRIEDYQSVFKSMSQQIDDFFLSKRNGQQDDQAKTKLNQFKELVSQQSNEGSQNSIYDPLVEQPKQALENVEEIKLKNERLIHALQRLSATHTTVKKQARGISKLQKKITQLTEGNHQQVEEKIELEQLVDNLRHEMESMLEEVEQLKQDRDLYARKANTLERDMHTISTSSTSTRSLNAMQSQLDVYQKQVNELEQTHQEEQRFIEKLRNENRQLTDDNYALKRDLSRMTSKHQSEMAVIGFEKMGLLKKIDQLEKQSTSLKVVTVEERPVTAPQQGNTDLEIALRRTVAERDGQLAKLNVLLERKQREMEQVGVNQEKRIQLEVSARENELKQQMVCKYKKENDTFQLNLSRETRALSYKIADLEVELEGVERQLYHQTKTLETLKSNEEKLNKEIKHGRETETELKTCIYHLEQRAITMEQETLHLYSRNLKLSHQLGDLDL